MPTCRFVPLALLAFLIPTAQCARRIANAEEDTEAEQALPHVEQVKTQVGRSGGVRQEGVVGNSLQVQAGLPVLPALKGEPQCDPLSLSVGEAEWCCLQRNVGCQQLVALNHQLQAAKLPNAQDLVVGQSPADSGWWFYCVLAMVVALGGVVTFFFRGRFGSRPALVSRPPGPSALQGEMFPARGSRRDEENPWGGGERYQELA
eukprot:Hpha_TRINITY_DN13689_c0_g2::TRINITY_DN13689_c0_g2_i1::g.122750::m.122750